MLNTLKLTITAVLLTTASVSVSQENSIDFANAGGDYVNCGNNASLDITGNTVTIEAWVNPDGFKPQVWGGCIINKNGPGDNGYMLRTGNNGQVNFNIGSNPGSWNEINTGTGVLVTGSWQHVAGTYDGTTMRIYVNGVEITSGGLTANIGSTTNSLLIGEDPWWSGREFNGKIDEVMVWNTARTEAEINQDMNYGPCTPLPSGLVAYYRFNQGVATGNNAGLTNVIDETGVNNGTLINSTLNGFNSNWHFGIPALPPFDASFNLTAINCNSAEAIVTGTDGGTFTWNPNPGDGSVLDGNTGDITSATGGSTYTVDYDICGVSSTDNVTLPTTGDASFTFNVVCGGAEATITGDDGGTFSWNPNPGDGAQLNTSTGNITNGVVGMTYNVSYTICGTTNTESATVLDDNCWTLNGDAQYITVGGEQCIQLTDEINNQTGCAWNGAQIDFASSFTLSLDYYFGNNIGGADGNTFTFQPSASTACGQPGGQLGAGGLSNALSIEFDTYDNDNPWHVYDMLCDHIAVEIDGDHQNTTPFAGPVCAKASSANIDDGGVYTVDIEWNASTQILNIYFDGVLRLPCPPYDIVTNVFGGQSQVYWGATSATGGLNNQQYFCPSTISVLPVELGSFTSVCSGEKEKFEWTTISEDRVDYFQLEYTYDGLVFYPVDEVNAAGTSQSENTYASLVDTKDAKQRYYRLKIVDENGDFEYTDIISSKRCFIGDLITHVKQESGIMTVTTRKHAQLQLTNALGQVIYQGVSEDDHLQIDTRSITNGVYFIIAEDKDGLQESKKVYIAN